MRVPIYGLDLIRFAAAILVAVYHFGYRGLVVSDDPVFRLLTTPAANPIAGAWAGWVGVQVFFVISGLVISYSASSSSWRGFLTGRITRLLPCMVVCATLIACIEIFILKSAVGSIAIKWIGSVLFSPIGPWLSGVMWTLPVEILFYSLVLGLIAMGRSGQISVLAWALSAFSFVYLCACAAGIELIPRRLGVMILLEHGAFFALGMIIFLAFEKKSLAGFYFPTSMCLVSSVLQIHRTASFKAEFEIGMGSYVLPVLVFFSVVVTIALSMIYRDYIASKIGRSGGWIRILGLSTYPLYLIHIHSGFVFSELLRMGCPLLFAMFLVIALSTTIAAIIAIYIEPPLQRLSKRLIGLALVERRARPLIS